MNLIEQENKLFYLVGETVVNFQRIDYILTDFLYTLLEIKHEQNYLLLMDALSFSQKVSLTFEILRSKDKLSNDKLSEIDLILAKKCLMKAEEFRNKIVHSLYFVDMKDMQFKKQKSNIKGKNGLKTKVSKINYDDLENCNQELQKLSLWFMRDNSLLEKTFNTLNKYNETY
jgi:hypothetical protein